MLLTTASNTWGSVDGNEVQRIDLWRLNMSAAVLYFASIPEELFAAAGLSKSKLPDATAASFYASKVALPVQKIDVRKIIQGTIPRNMPGYFDALDTVRVEFIHDSADDSSPIYTLLQIWKAIVRVGRAGQSREPVLLLPTSTFRPQFKFDIVVELLNGAGSDTKFNFEGIDPWETGEATPTETGMGLVEGAKYVLSACWPRIVQHAQIDRGQKAQVHTLSAQFQVQEIIA